MMRSPFNHVEVLDPWMDEVTMALSNLQATDTNFATVTVTIQSRLNSEWTEHDTLSLPEALFDRLLDYALGEREGWQEEAGARRQEAEAIEDKTAANTEESTPASELLPSDSSEGKVLTASQEA